MKKTILAFFVILVLSFSVFAQGQDNKQSQQMIEEHVEGGSIDELSQGEIDGLLLMREEEKLAKDVYLELYDKWNTPIFSNIASSEETHTNAVRVLLEAYDIEDPVVSDVRGEYKSEELSALYTTLVEKGKQSLLDAMIVGATVEDLDIKDLNELLENTQNKDIIQVYENLRKGSRNHMRSFIKQIEKNNGNYEAQYISSEELESILGTDQERGPLLDDNSSIVPGFEAQLRKGQADSQRGMQDGSRKSLQPGLTNALSRVKNENARGRLQRNLENFEQKYSQRMQRMQDVEVEEFDEEAGTVRVRAKEQVKWFGIFKGSATKRFDIDKNGNINERAPWYRFLYSQTVE